MINISVKQTIKYCILIPLLLFGIIILLSTFIIGRNHGSYNNLKSILPFNLNKNDITSNSLNPQKIRVFITSKNKVVELNLEDYVAGVVSSEMPSSFEIEALKAQAVAARTYAVSRIKSLDGKSCSLHPEADVCDTVHCQVYKSKDEKLQSGYANSQWDKIEQAVHLTQNEILTYNGKVISDPLYFASSGGKTEDSQQVFSSNVPYLKSVESPGERDNPRLTTTNIPVSSFVSTINIKYPNSKLSIAKLKSQIKILDINTGGTVNQIKLGAEIIKGVDFRKMFNLKSANFQITILSKSIQIVCIGSGHDVGMSQYGANNIAKSGSNYKDILTHFYQGIEIKKINS